MEQLLETGKIVSVHALKGEVKVEPGLFPHFLAEFDELFLDGEWVEVERARVQKNMVILKLQGVDTPEAAGHAGWQDPLHRPRPGGAGGREPTLSPSHRPEGG